MIARWALPILVAILFQPQAPSPVTIDVGTLLAGQTYTFPIDVRNECETPERITIESLLQPPLTPVGWPATVEVPAKSTRRVSLTIQVESGWGRGQITTQINLTFAGREVPPCRPSASAIRLVAIIDTQDPRDEPGPIIWGEEIDEDEFVEGWFAPMQGVWQDDAAFKDCPGKQVTPLGRNAWRAELKMVVGRPTVIGGMRDDNHTEFQIKGMTRSQLAPAKLRITVIQGDTRKIVYEDPMPNHWVPIDVRSAGATSRPWFARIGAVNGFPTAQPFTIDTAGAYRIEAEFITPSGKATGAAVVVSGEAVETRGLRIAFVPVWLSAQSAAGAELLDAFAAAQAALTQTKLPEMFPLRPGAITAEVLSRVDFSDEQTVPQDILDLLRALQAELDPEGGPAAPFPKRGGGEMIEARLTAMAAVAGYDRIVAVLAPADFKAVHYQAGIEARAQSQKLIIALDTADETTIAHEVMHTLPYLWADPQMIQEFGFSWHNEKGGPIAHGLDVQGTRRRFDDAPSLMGAATDPERTWITQGGYFHLLQELRADGGRDTGCGTSTPSTPGAAPPGGGQAAPPSKERVQMVRGVLARRGTTVIARLGNVFDTTAVPTLSAKGPGEFAIVLRDAARRELARYPFTAVWRLPHTDVDRNIVVFTHAVPAHPDTAVVELVGPSGVDARPLSANAPAIRITSPLDIAAVDDHVMITWAASDADGDPLRFTVLTSVDDGTTWTPAAFEQIGLETRLRVPSGISRIRVRVLAVDGTRSGEAEATITIRGR